MSSVRLHLLIALAALNVVAAVGTTCRDSQCFCQNNWLTYSNELLTRTGSSTPTGCPLPDKCNCAASPPHYKLGTYQISYPIALRNPRPSDAQTATAPWMYSSAVSRSQCCDACQNMNKDPNDPTKKPHYCAYWLHMLTGTSGCNAGATPTGCGFCLIYPPGTSPSCPTLRCSNPPFSSSGSSQIAGNVSVVGKGCPGARNDPHFVGANGAHFDFNGSPDKSFCLITEKKFQVNMKMRGYYDQRTVGASVLKNGMAVRTWIKELGVMWADATSAMHTFKMVARDGKSNARDSGFVGAMKLDGKVLPLMVPGDSLKRSAIGFSLVQLPHEMTGNGFFELDAYRLEIAGLLTVEIRLRIAHPLLQTDDDAMTHINVKFVHVASSKATHGVLGQTFQPGREKRALKYTQLAGVLGHDIAADSEEGKGFLDGKPEDYQTTDTLEADCKYSQFALASAA